MGDSSKEYDKKVVLIAKDPVQIRHNALEAGRKSANRTLELTLGKGMYHMRLRVYPHHILRENPMATGAGADRTSEGMKRAFGKPIGLAAQVDDGQVIAEANVKEKDLDVAKKALNKFKYKVPCTCSVEVKDWTE
jgi:large subunit ribosomal protein L10e